MFNHTAMIVGSSTLSRRYCEIIALEILASVENEERIARMPGKSSASAMEYLQDVYRKRVDKMYDSLDSPMSLTETKNEITIRRLPF